MKNSDRISPESETQAASPTHESETKPVSPVHESETQPASPAHESETKPASPVSIDLEQLRLPQNFQQYAGARRVLNTVPVRKPHRQEFVRVRAGNEWSYQTLALHLKNPFEMYLVAQDLWLELSRELTPMLFVLAANTLNDVFLWPLRMPTNEGRRDSWAESAFVVAGRAEHKFVRLIPNMQQGIFDVVDAGGSPPEPSWPERSMNELLELAFRGHYIDTLQHPVVQQLLGNSW